MASRIYIFYKVLAQIDEMFYSEDNEIEIGSIAMHEVGIMERTLEIAIDRAGESGASQIHRLKMRVGVLSGVVPEALTFAFDVVTEGTIAQNAQFEIESVPAQCYCSQCRETFEPKDIIFECPSCHQFSATIFAGKELELTSMEVS